MQYAGGKKYYNTFFSQNGQQFLSNSWETYNTYNICETTDFSLILFIRACFIYLCNSVSTIFLLSLPVFRQDLVELWRGDEEEYGRDRVEALRPFLPLRPLPSHVDEYKWHIVDVDGAFCDAFGGLPAVQDILVRGYIVRSRDALELVEEVTNWVALKLKEELHLVSQVSPKRQANMYLQSI